MTGSRDLNFVFQSVLVLTSAIGDELQSSCASFDDMVLSLMRVICTAKPKIRGAANKAFQKALASWPSETNAAVARADDEWRTNELVQKLLVPAAHTSEASSSKPLAAAVTSGLPTAAARKVPKVETELDLDSDKQDAKVTEENNAVTTAVEVQVDKFDSMVVGKSSGGVSSADMYGSERPEGPHSALLDLLNGYVSDTAAAATVTTSAVLNFDCAMCVVCRTPSANWAD